VTPARADLITGYDSACEAAEAAGATGVTVSGAGPAILAVCRERDQRDVASALVEGFEADGVDATAYRSSVGDGAQIL
jgi:homoserine kinase